MIIWYESPAAARNYVKMAVRHVQSMFYLLYYMNDLLAEQEAEAETQTQTGGDYLFVVE